MVYVLDKNNNPLMPCTNVVARLLLKDGKAKVKRKTPFTIKMLVDTANFTQTLTCGIDTGSGTLGCAVVRDNGITVYQSEVQVRNDISKKMTQRASYRRTRRNRKTRYRKARFLNGKNSIKKDRFSPTMRSKFDSHEKEVNFVKSILPISKVILETGTFDPHLLKDPSLAYRKWGYQKGTLFNYGNIRAYILQRDGYKCKQCNTKKGTMEVHHIIFRKNGGSDDPENLITLCHDCHQSLHNEEIKLKNGGKKKGTLKYATQMNSIRKQLLNRIDCTETFGYITKEQRWQQNLPKAHYVDAAIIASEGKEVSLLEIVYYKKSVSKGDYQQTKGKHSEKSIPTGKVNGFRKFDKVKYFGKEYFIKGRRTAGTVELMDIFGNKISFAHYPKGRKTPKASDCIKIQTRRSTIIQAIKVA